MTSERSLQAGQLAVRFEQVEDRFVHRLFAVAEEDSVRPPILLAESVEGSPDEAWPDSPPYTQVESIAGARGPGLLAVGLAGSSHWSASVTSDPEGSALIFDVACRAASAPANLGSTYQLTKTGSPLAIEALPVEGCENSQSWNAQNRAGVRPLGAGGQLPATFRWKYAVRLVTQR